MPKKRGKKYIEAAKKIEAAVASNGNGGLDPDTAVTLAKETSISKFDATVEASAYSGAGNRIALARRASALRLRMSSIPVW